MRKELFTKVDECFEVKLGCSRIELNFEFQDKFVLINRQKSISLVIVAIGSSLTIVKMIYQFIQSWFLYVKYRNFLGQRILEADELREIRRTLKL